MQTIRLILFHETIAIGNKDADFARFNGFGVLNEQIVSIVESGLHTVTGDGNDFVSTAKIAVGAYILGFLQASETEKDYSILGSFAPVESSGTCVYCNHCQPCPAGLDIGLINKYYDLALAGDALAKDHYAHLGAKASDCLDCRHCDSRCPFHVHQSQRMREIAGYFGN